MSIRAGTPPNSSRRSIIFDLDGTLIDPLLGISRAYQRMCASLGIPNLSEDEIRGLIGPSIREALAGYFKFDQETLERAVQVFRHHYSSNGILEYRKYPGIDELLSGLRKQGFDLHIATNKPVVFANRIVQHARWQNLFTIVSGSSLDRSVQGKKEIISLVIKQLPPGESVLAYVGDRPEDAQGSHPNGLSFVGVSWGFSTAEVLLEAGAVAVAASAQQLESVIHDLRSA